MLKSLLFVLALASVAVYGRPPNSLVVESLLKNGYDVGALPFERLPPPDQMIFSLNEDEFEAYLDYWNDRQRDATLDKEDARATCTVSINNLPEPQPVYVVNGRLLAPNGNSKDLSMTDSQPVTAACPGTNNGIVHSGAPSRPASGNLVCQSGSSFSGPGWLSGNANFADIKCTSHPTWAETRSGTCYSGRGANIQIAVQAGSNRYGIINSCFSENNAEALFVTYDQTPENAAYQSNVGRPDFQQGAWYPGLSVNTLYTQNSQKAAIASVVGNALADVYVNSTYFLARGHLAAKTDFVLAASQRATFTFINCIPQWQPFNGGNWNTLEQNLRTRIGAAGYRTKVYTGSWGILKLKDSSGVGRDIYLSPSNKKIPVPLWMYKVVHDTSTNRATAFLGLNNMHVSLAEAKSMAFCTDRCLGNSNFGWLNWKPEDMRLGYSICCDVSDFRRVVDHLPSFTVSGLLY